MSEASRTDAAFAVLFGGPCACPENHAGRPDGTWSALNDISVHRKAGLRVADLAYALAGEEIGRIDSDMKGPRLPAAGTSIPKTRRPKGPFGTPQPA